MSGNTETLLISKTQLSVLLGVHRKTLERWVKAGRFPEPFNHDEKQRCYWLRSTVNRFFAQAEEKTPLPQLAARSVIAKRIKKTLAEKEKVRERFETKSA